MALAPPSIDDFRRSLLQGYSAVRGQSHARPEDRSLQSALSEYRRIFGIFDAMTREEQSSPMTVIDSERIRRIACGAGSMDQEVIQLLFSYRDFCEQFLKAG